MGSPPGEIGRFDDEGPQHRVQIKAFAAGKYEVTWDEYDACVLAGACSPATDDGFGKGARPVTNVSWDDAKAYVRWRSVDANKRYRLLSEAEWEYAARAGTDTEWSHGNDESKLGNYAWYARNSGGKTQVVGQKLPNAFGLFDMHGNVWEWTQDCRHNNYVGAPTDGNAWTTGCTENGRVLRGGSWLNFPAGLRSAFRNGVYPVYRFNDYGFRLARTLFTP
jgi:formylglycine-generating enzyme required for sulfatase activity